MGKLGLTGLLTIIIAANASEPIYQKKICFVPEWEIAFKFGAFGYMNTGLSLLQVYPIEFGNIPESPIDEFAITLPNKIFNRTSVEEYTFTDPQPDDPKIQERQKYINIFLDYCSTVYQ